MTEPKEWFFGWKVVAASFVAQCLTVGTVFYAFGVFFVPLQEEFGWSRGEISWGFSFAALFGAVYAPILGRWIDRHGPKPVQIAGAVSLSIGFLALSRIGSLTAFYIVMALPLAAGGAAFGPMASNTAVAKWFIKKRGRALGISTAGISMGGVIFVRTTQAMIEAWGWRGAFTGLAVIVATVGIPPVLLWMRRSPEEMGLRPDGEPAERSRGTADLQAFAEEIEHSVSPREAVRSREFWLIAVAFGLTVGGLSAILLHQIPFLIDRGVSPRVASWVLGGTAAVGVIGKLGFGTLIDRFDQRRVILGCFLLQAGGIGLLFFASHPVALAAYVVVYGYAMGGNATLQATVVGACFGRLHYGAIAGRMTPVIVALQALAVPLVGMIRDWTGTYRLAFSAIIALTLAATTCVSALRLRGSTA